MITTQKQTVDTYINSFPKEVKEKLEIIRNIIRELAPKAEERISYQMPAFRLNNSNFIFFAAWKKHIALYPYTASIDEHFKQEAAAYKSSGKGTIQFPLDKPLPLDLIRKIVAYKIKENEKRKNSGY